MVQLLQMGIFGAGRMLVEFSWLLSWLSGLPVAVLSTVLVVPFAEGPWVTFALPIVNEEL